MVEPPSGTVTLLFTDIEGSTKLLQRAGDAYADLLAEHRRLLREAFGAHGGYEVDTEGDAFFVTFSSAKEAVVAAADGQRALAGRPWPEGCEVRVRIGLHTGEPRLIDSDYVGLDVHRAARVMAAGHGGQVLVSQSTRDLLDDSFQLRDLGEHRLKDLSQPQRLYQLRIDGLPNEFPPLKTLGNRVTNLPVQATPFVGREVELTDVESLLRRDDVRLITLTGAGGTGKTRLALQAAANLVDDFANGVFFVSLAPIRDPDLVVQAIAQTLGLREQGGEPLVQTLREYFADRSLLLILDNLEQIVTAAPTIASLLQNAPRLEVLATSRRPLNVSGEHTYHVPPLALPDPAATPEVERLARSEAVALFVHRAEAARPDFSLNEANAGTIAEICVRLDGLPLALELAAARIRTLPPQTLLAHLDQRLDLLTGGAQDMEERQRTLRATVEWSYDLLSDAEKRLFARLSVFADGCRPDAATDVCAAEDQRAIDVLDALSSLTENSLLRQREDPDGEPRYWMLETIREFAFQRLSEHGEADELTRRHLQYFAALAEQADPHLRAADQREWLERLESDHQNFRRAFDSGLDDEGELDLAGRLATALFEFWDIRGHYAEARRSFEALLEREDRLTPLVTAEATRALGFLTLRQGEAKASTPLLQRAVELFEESGDQRGTANALGNLAFSHLHLGDLEKASAFAERGHSLASAQGDPWVIACTTGALSAIAFERRDRTRGMELGREGMRLFGEIGDYRNRAIWHLNLGGQALEAGDLDIAEGILDEAVADARMVGDEMTVAFAMWARADLWLLRGDIPEAMTPLREALRFGRDRNVKQLIAGGLASVAYAAAKTGNAESAAGLLGASTAALAEWGLAPEIIEMVKWRDQAEQLLRSHLDPDRLEVATDEGRAMGTEAAVEAALVLAERLLQVPTPEQEDDREEAEACEVGREL